ncbi:MAG: hypothetical protein ACM30D_06780, partial [Hyphomicrobiales bacterium]
LLAEGVAIRFWHEADIPSVPAFVRYWTKADIGHPHFQCLFKPLRCLVLSLGAILKETFCPSLRVLGSGEPVWVVAL